MNTTLVETSKTKQYVDVICVLVSMLLLAACGDSTQEIPTSNEGIVTVASLRDKIRINPDDPALRLNLARLYLQEGNAAAAESNLRHALRMGTNDTHASADLVRSLLLQEHFFEALEMVESLQSDPNAPQSARLWMLRGEAQLGRKSFDQQEIRRSFLEAFRALSSVEDSALSKRLDELSRREVIVAAARSHIKCSTIETHTFEPRVSDHLRASGRVIKVGPAHAIKLPSQAAKSAQDGDLIEIEAGVYRGDVAIWTQNDIVLRGVGGIARLEAAGQHADGKAIWIFEGNNITAENIGFSGASVPHRNGAGIRLLGKGATIRNCHFHDNENGILGGSNPENDVLVEFSTFERNGYGDGQSHNIYIGRARSFTLRYSYSHAAHVGHLVKSRAAENIILFNRLVDGEEGDSSYVIDLPEGGNAWIIGNELQQGSNSENPVMISFGEEISDKKNQSLLVINNTFYNQVLDGTFVRNSTEIDVLVANNLFAGAPATVLLGPGAKLTNLQQPGPWLVDARTHDFRLNSIAPAIDAGTDPLTFKGLRYFPDARYQHRAVGQSRKSVGPIDIGAHEFCGL